MSESTLPPEPTVANREAIQSRTAHIDHPSLGVVLVCMDPTGLLAAAMGWNFVSRLRPAVASALREKFGEHPIVWEGPCDHLVLVFFDVDKADPETVERDLAERLSRQVDVDGRSFFIPTYLGIAIASEVSTACDAIDLVRASGAAVHQAILSSATSVRATADSIELLQQEVAATTELAKAIGSDFSLHYQPIVDLSTRQRVGFESLLRWQVGDELRLPADFLDAAETTSLIVPIGRWGLTAALGQLAQWQRKSGDTTLFMSVNFSARQLVDRGLVQHVADAIATSGVPAATVWVEVTERNLIETGSPAAQTLLELDALGCTICVDDLGTGFAALRYMVEQPVQVVKIDRSLVSKVGIVEPLRSVVGAVCALSASLGILTVAEGVESEDQVDKLRDLGFTHAQGFLFGKPAPATEFEF
ncbi:EAL domain-containing protein [Williamsia sp.]|uniref:EAL domain-containing protein n=1 Tax=Williamsia sp. TaxID=1872085 RepID=UPI002F920396